MNVDERDRTSGFESLKFEKKRKINGTKDVHQQREKEIYKQIKISDTSASRNNIKEV